MAYLNGIEQLFGMTLTLGGGPIIGAPVPSQDPPSSLTVTTFEIETTSYTAPHTFLQGLNEVWDWDSYVVNSDSTAYVDFGGFRLRMKSKENRLYFSNMYGANGSGTDYGSITFAAGTVTLVKGQDVLLIIAPANVSSGHYCIAVGYATDDRGDKHKCMFAAPQYSTYSTRVVGGMDNDTEIIGFRGSTYYNDNLYRTMNRTDELAPLFVDSAELTVIADKILLLRAYSDLLKTGLYTVGDSKVYYGFTLALKDGG